MNKNIKTFQKTTKNSKPKIVKYLNIFITSPILNQIECSWAHFEGKTNVNKVNVS